MANRIVVGDAVTVRHRGSGVCGVRSLPGRLVDKVVETVPEGFPAFTVLHVETEWPYRPGMVMRIEFATDNLSLGSIREWQLFPA